MRHKQNHPTDHNIPSSPLVGKGWGGSLRRGRPRKGHLARDISIIIALKVIALAVIKVVWFSDPPVPTDANVARALFESAGGMTHKQRQP